MDGNVPTVVVGWLNVLFETWQISHININSNFYIPANIISSNYLLFGEMVMEFNGKFFFFAFVLSIVAGIVGNIYQWLHYFIRLTPESIKTFWIFLTPITMAFGIILPFILMYMESKKINPETNLIPILVSTFLGTWIGRLIADIGINTFIVYYTIGYYTGYNIFEFAFTLARQIFVLALSPTIFILTTAILLAYYQKSKEEQPPD